MTTNNKDFRVKNGLVVDGANATVNGNEVLTNAASINALSDVTVSSPTSGQVLKWNGSAWINDTDATSAGGNGNSFETISANGTSVVADSSTDTLTITPGDGLSIVGNATSDTITFTPNVAGASANGIVTTGTQTFAGEKTFSNNITASANIIANSGYVSADTFRLDTTYAGGSTQPGEISWDPDNETAMIALDAGETLQIGQEHVIRVKNSSGSVAIPKGRVVMFAGATGDTVKVTPAISTQAYEPLLLVGITAEAIAADGFGFVTQYGFINQVSTGSFTLGDLLYVDPANPGVLVNSVPSAPNWTFSVATVTRVHASAGRILVRAIPGGHLRDVVDVAISSPADNELLAYNSANGTWINQTAEEAGVANLSGATFTGNVAGTNISMSGNVNATTVTATTFNGINNYVINGGFDFWQRGTSFSATGYTADRWYFTRTSLANVTRETTNLPVGFTYALKANAPTSNDRVNLRYAFERTSVIPLRGKTVTFSAYLKMDANMRGLGDFYFVPAYSTTTDARASVGDSIPGADPATLTKSSYADWARFTYTLVVPTDAVGLLLEFEPPLSDINQPVWWITGAQLEVGSVATEFKRAGSTYTEEQNACFRYYYRATAESTYGWFGQMHHPSSIIGVMQITIPVNMRTIPSTLDSSAIGTFQYLGATGTLSSLSLSSDGNNSRQITVNVNGSSFGVNGSGFLRANNSATAFIGVTAEL